MKRFLLLLIPFIFLSCSSNFWTGKQAFLLNNLSSKTVVVTITDEDSVQLAPGKNTTVYAYADSKFTVDSYFRCDVTFNSDTRGYDIIDSIGKSVTAYNNSTKDIMLCESKGKIGTYKELEAAAASQGISISDVSIQKKIEAGASVTFIVYSNNPNFYAYYCENGTSASMELISFNLGNNL